MIKRYFERRKLLEDFLNLGFSEEWVNIFKNPKKLPEGFKLNGNSLQVYDKGVIILIVYGFKNAKNFGLKSVINLTKLGLLDVKFMNALIN